MHHHHRHDSSSERIGVAFFLNLGFTLVEFVGGWLTGSVAILADAVHDLGDTLSLGLGWIMDRQGQRSADARFTYGYRRLSLMAALVNGLVLMAGAGWVLSEAVPRLWQPEMPHAPGMVGLAVLGLAVNGYAAWRLGRGRTLNERVLGWHLLEDVLGWLAVLLVAVVLLFVDWPILDPLLSILFTLFILFNVGRNVAASVRLFLQAVPDRQVLAQIEDALLGIEHVTGLHHLHLWSLDGEHHVLTAHVVLDARLDAELHARVKDAIDRRLAPFGLAHTTIELEQAGEVCRLPAERVE